MLLLVISTIVMQLTNSDHGFIAQDHFLAWRSKSEITAMHVGGVFLSHMMMKKKKMGLI